MDGFKGIKVYLEKKSNGQLTGEALEQAVLAFCTYIDTLYAVHKQLKDKENKYVQKDGN